MICRQPISKRIFAHDGVDKVRPGCGVEDEVEDGVGGGAAVVAEGVMEEVVQDPSIEVGLGSVVVKEALSGAGAVFPGAGGGIAHANGEDALFFQVSRHLVGLAVEHDLEAVLDPAEEAVGIFHDSAFLGGEAADLFEPSHGAQGIGVTNLWVLAAVEELEELDDELDVADAAVAGLDLDLGGAGGESALFDPPLHRLDFADLRAAQVTAVNEGCDGVQESFSEVKVAGDGSALDEGLPFPGASGGFVVAEGGGEGTGEGSLVAFRAEAHIDAIGHAEHSMVGEEADDFASHSGEEFGVGDGSRAKGLAFEVVEEDQIDVRAVVELLSAELAEGEDDEFPWGAVGAGGSAVFTLGASASESTGPFDADVGEDGEVEGDEFQREAADDVGIADAEQFALAEAPQREPFVVLVGGFAEGLPELVEQSAGVAPFSAGAKPIEERGLSDEEFAEILASAEELKSDFCGTIAGGEEGESLVGLSASRDEAFEICEGHPGVGATGQEDIEVQGQSGH